MDERKNIVSSPLPPWIRWLFGDNPEEIEQRKLIRKIPIMVHYAKRIRSEAEEAIRLIDEHGNMNDELTRRLRDSLKDIARDASDLLTESEPGNGGPLT